MREDAVRLHRLEAFTGRPLGHVGVEPTCQAAKGPPDLVVTCAARDAENPRVVLLEAHSADDETRGRPNPVRPLRSLYLRAENLRGCDCGRCGRRPGRVCPWARHADPADTDGADRDAAGCDDAAPPEASARHAAAPPEAAGARAFAAARPAGARARPDDPEGHDAAHRHDPA